MFTNIDEVLNYIYSKKRVDLGLERINRALELVGNPQFNFKTIHIAGTNGKGSTTNYIYTILKEAGYKVGAFTSPFLETYNDRIRVNDKFVSDEFVIEVVNKHYLILEELNLSFFELFTFIASLYFESEKVDFAIYEVGMGGRYDASNVIKPLVCGITNIGFDHMSSLGDTISEIAYQKAGIIKPSTPVFTTCEKQDAIETIKQVASDLGSECIVLNDFEQFNYELSMKGTYQKKNATLALNIIKYLSQNYNISEESIIEGFKKAKWLGRFEEISENIFIDGAHNIEGITGLIDTIQSDFSNKNVQILFSALADKEVDEMLNMLKQYKTYITTFNFYRAMSTEQIKSLGFDYFDDYKKGIDVLKKEVNEDNVLIITGSLYFITEVRKYLFDK